MNVKTDFLNEKLEEELNMKVPEGVTAQKEIVCKLKTCAYGHKVPDFLKQGLINLFCIWVFIDRKTIKNTETGRIYLRKFNMLITY